MWKDVRAIYTRTLNKNSDILKNTMTNLFIKTQKNLALKCQILDFILLISSKRLHSSVSPKTKSSYNLAEGGSKTNNF